MGTVTVFEGGCSGGGVWLRTNCRQRVSLSSCVCYEVRLVRYLLLWFSSIRFCHTNQ